MATIHHFAVQDRSQEFRACVASLTKINRQQNQYRPSRPTTPKAPRSEFASRAADISNQIAETTAMLARLALLARKKTLFDDRPVEIAELTFVVKQKVALINKNIAALQQYVKTTGGNGPDGGRNKKQEAQMSEHANNVVVLLQGRLTKVTTTFEEVLETRLKNIQAQKNRTEQFIAFSGAASAGKSTGSAVTSGIDRESPLYSVSRSRGQAKSQNTPAQTPPPGASANPYAFHDYPEEDQSYLTLPHDQHQQMALLEEQEHHDAVYQNQRGLAVNAIESTIQELGGIFAQLASMVAEQRDVIQRIDADTEDISLNVSGAHRELLKYYARISSNRWLLIKLFGMLILFFFIWVIVS